jgi:hypothetical protein
MINQIFKEFKEKNCEENESKLFNIIQDYSDSLEDQQDVLNKVRCSVGIHQHYVSIEKKLIYLKIDKCASSSIGEYFSTRGDFIPIHEDSLSIGFPEYDVEKIKNFNIFTVIRNPKSRWISGLNELISCVHKGSINELEIYIEQELTKNKFVFDGHTLPQIACLPSKMDSSFISNLILLRLDKNLNQKISSLLGEDVQLKHNNRTSTDPNKKNNLNFCKKMFKTYCEKNPKYYQTYEFDYRLFNLSQ